MVKRNLAGGARQEGQVIFILSCGGDGWVREYVYKSFRVALCSIIYTFCVELWLSLRPGNYRGTATLIYVFQYYSIMYLNRYIFSFHVCTQYTTVSIPGSQYLEYVDPGNVLLVLSLIHI